MTSQSEEPVLTQSMPRSSPQRAQREAREPPASSEPTSDEHRGGFSAVPHSYSGLAGATWANAKDAGDALRLQAALDGKNIKGDSKQNSGNVSVLRYSTVIMQGGVAACEDDGARERHALSSCAFVAGRRKELSSGDEYTPSCNMLIFQ